jgi:hypothetical protein
MEPVERRIQGSVFHLEHVVGLPLDDLGDGLAMGGTEDQRSQDQHVQRSLHHLGLQRRMASRHSLLSMID